MLSTLMTHAAVRLCGGWCCQCYVCSGRIHLCSFGNASLHVWYAAVSVWHSSVSFWSKVKRVTQTSRPASFLYTTARLGVFLLHQSLFTGCFNWFSPGRLDGNLALCWRKLNCENAVHKRQNELVHNNVHQAEYNTFSSRSPKIWTSSWTIVHWTRSGTTLTAAAVSSS